MRFFNLILFLLFPLLLKAQQNATLVDTIIQPEITAIPLAEIPSKAERLIQKINKDYQKEINLPTVHEVQILNDTLQATGLELARLSNLILNQDIPYYILETVVNRLSRFIPIIEKEEKRLESYSSQLSIVNEDINKIAETWALTKEQAKEIVYPEAIEKRVDEILVIIDSVKTVLNDSLSNCLSLQNTLVDLQINADNHLKELTDYKTQTLSELLSTKETPIWALQEAKDTSLIDFNLNLLLEYSQEDIDNFFLSEEVTIIFILVLFLILYFAFIWMRSNYKELHAKQVDELELGKYIFSRAAPSALLFAIIIQSLILEKKPYVLELGITVIIFILFLIIIPGLVSKKLRWSIYLFGFIFLFVNFDLLFFNSHNEVRIISLLESLTIFGFLSWFLIKQKKVKPIDPSKRVLYSFLNNIGPIFFILIIIGLLANIIGYIYLSRLINLGIINSSLVWLLLVAAYRIIKGLSYLFLETNFALRSRIVLSRRKDILKLINFVFKNGIVVLWLYYSLEFFKLYDPFINIADSIWNWGLKTETIDLSVGKIVSFIFILFLGLSLANFVKILLQVEILSRFKFSRGVPLAIASITNYLLIVIGFFAALGFAGFDLSKISFIVGALGVGIGFGLQNVVSNFVSGLILIFERPIAIGDIIIVENVEGTVTSIGIRSSKILQYNGDEEIIPNAIFINGKVTNRTLTNNQRRFIITIYTSLTTEPELVLDLMKKAGNEVEGVLSYPEPKAYFEGISGQSLKFSLYYWIGDNILDTVSETNLKVHQYLREAGIQIPIPRQIEYHLDNIDEVNPVSKKEVKKDEKDENGEQS